MSDDRSYDAPNYAFQDYATSGAFQLSLTRRQVAELGQVLSDPLRACYVGGCADALLRKGLLVAITGAPQGLASQTPPEYRPTLAGLHVAALCRIAGLSQGAADPVAGEIAALQAELSAARAAQREAQLDARSLAVRLEAAEIAVKALEFERDHGWPGAVPPMVRLRDPRPDRVTAEIIKDLEGVQA